MLTSFLFWIGGFNVMASVTSGGPPWWLSLLVGVACTLVGIKRLVGRGDRYEALSTSSS